MELFAEVFDAEPEGFKASLEVSGCYIEVEGSLLLVQAAPFKGKMAGKWGLPGGKLDLGESPEKAAQRELFEETGIQIQDSILLRVGSFFLRIPEVEFVFHIYHVPIYEKPKVTLSTEHSAYLWATQEDLKTLPLLPGAVQVLDGVRKRLQP